MLVLDLSLLLYLMICMHATLEGFFLMKNCQKVTLIPNFGDIFFFIKNLQKTYLGQSVPIVMFIGFFFHGHVQKARQWH